MSGAPDAPADGGQGETPPASPPAPQSPPPSPPAPPPEPPAFHTRFADPEDRGYAENKGWKSENDLLKSYRSLEKLRGVPAERLLTLPEDITNAEAMKPILEKLGFAPPAEAKDYGFAAIEGVNPETASGFEAIALKHGIPKSMAEAAFKDIVAAERAAIEAQTAREDEEAAVERGKFNAKYGIKAEEKIEAARRFAARVGIKQEVLENIEAQMGVFDFWEAMAKAGEGMGEGEFVEGGRRPSMDMSPEAAKSKHDMLMRDGDFRRRFLNGDVAAKEQIERLNRIMAGPARKAAGP